MEYEKKLKEFIAIQGEHVDINEICEDSNLVRDFGFTSIDIVQLVVFLEDEFSIEFRDDELELEKISIYKNLIEIIEKNNNR